MKMIHCAGCDGPIFDRFLLNVLDRSWHVKCVRCCECKCTMTDKCFSRDEKLYCRTDFFRRFGTKCSGCGQGISPTDLVRRARTKVFHLECFTCLVCRKQLSTGEELYVLDENRFVCKDDYMNSRHKRPNMSSSPPDQSDLDEPSYSISGSYGLDRRKKERENSLDREVKCHMTGETVTNIPAFDSYDSPAGLIGSHTEGIKNTSFVTDSKINDDSDTQKNGTNSTNQNLGAHSNDENSLGSKRRGPRTTIKAKQLEMLKAAFAATPKPTRHIREQLAQETGLSMRVIQVWFQNRRSKERRMKQLSSLGVKRHFYRGPRRAMRPIRSGLSPDGLDIRSDVLGGRNAVFGYFSDSSSPRDFQYGSQGLYEFYSGQQAPDGPTFHPGGMPQPSVGNLDQSVRMGTVLSPGHFSLSVEDCLHSHIDFLSHRSSPGMRSCLRPGFITDGHCPSRSSIDSVYHGGISHHALSETPVW